MKMRNLRIWRVVKQLRYRGLNTLIRRGARYVRYQLMRRALKFWPSNLLLSFKAAFNPDAILAFWYEPETRNSLYNFGDALNPILIKFLSGKEPIQSRKIFNIVNKPVYSVIGSVLERAKVKRLIVWGSGFMYPDGRFPQLPEKVLALRGPLSRQIFTRMGIITPEVFGDPALLCPMFYKPDVKKTHRLGIIPHFFDKGNPLLKHFLDDPEVKLIDIESGVYNVIDEINSCEYIASSSLHGIIVADAYGIQSLWISLSNKVGGGGFKFKDYFASVGRDPVGPVVITERTTLDELYSRFQKYEIHIDLEKLLQACPFLYSNNRLSKVK
jgi:pyruvyltransferase